MNADYRRAIKMKRCERRRLAASDTQLRYDEDSCRVGLLYI